MPLDALAAVKVFCPLEVADWLHPKTLTRRHRVESCAGGKTEPVLWRPGGLFNSQPIILHPGKKAGLQTQEKTSSSSHFASCSNIPVQATDFHTAPEPNIGINEV